MDTSMSDGFFDGLMSTVIVLSAVGCESKGAGSILPTVNGSLALQHDADRVGPRQMVSMVGSVVRLRVP